MLYQEKNAYKPYISYKYLYTIFYIVFVKLFIHFIYKYYMYKYKNINIVIHIFFLCVYEGCMCGCVDQRTMSNAFIYHSPYSYRLSEARLIDLTLGICFSPPPQNWG